MNEHTAPQDHVGLRRNHGITRRRLLRVAASGAAAAVAAPYILPASVLAGPGRVAPSDRLGIGIIGTGGRGNDHLRAFLGTRETRVLAACDANKPKAEAAKAVVDQYYAGRSDAAGSAGDKGCGAYSDFRELLARDDIDAVAIASPENWHTLHASYAAKAGKDIYCEKALSLTVREGRQLVQTIRRYARVLQVGTQQRSDRNFRFACELVRNGYIGKLQTVDVSVPGGTRLGNAPPKDPPPGLDYELWLGPAPWTPYNDIKCSFNWYFIYDYCAGWIQSWGVHHCDIALWGAPALLQSPLEVEGTAVFPTDGLANTSVTWRVKYTAANGVVCTFTDTSASRQGVTFTGDKGRVYVDRGALTAEPASLLKVAIKPGEEHLQVSNNHHGDFLEAIRTRRDPVAPVEAGHAATTITLVGDIATRLGRKLRWDWKAEQFPGDEEANRMLHRSMRSPWSM
jgi:predicted dehydrogenase